MSDMFDMTGKVVVVTGGAGLLGRSFGSACAARGATVYLADIDTESLSEASGASGSDIRPVTMDITDEGSVTKALAAIVGQTGRIDVWVNNAYPRTDDWGLKFENIPLDSWRANVDGHLNGYCLCCQKVAELMKQQGGGSIINIGSIYGIVGPDFSIYEGTGMTMPAAYAAIKGGVIQFTRYLASYYGSAGVRVNAVSPGGVYNGQDDTFVSKYSARVPLGRMADPDDIVGAVLFLASDASRYVTGHNLVVDGGWSIV